MNHTLTAFALLASLAFSASPVQAQGTSEEAKALFREGVRFAEGEQWERALSRFERAYELSPRVLILYNIAVAQMSTGRLVEAYDSYKKFLADTVSGEHPELRQEAQDSLAVLARQVGYVVLLSDGLEGSDIVSLDGKVIPKSQLGETRRVNPGSHSVTVKRNGVQISRRTFEVLEGQTRREQALGTIDPQALQTAQGSGREGVEDRSAGASKDEDDDSSVFESPVFWVVTGIVVVGAGVGAGIFVANSGSDPYTGNIGAGRISLGN